MYVRFLALFAILFLVPQNLWARIHTVARNVATVVHLQDGDEIELADLPNDWAFSRVVLGVNSVPSVQLSGMLVMNNCAHDLHGYYDEVAFAYTGENKVVYHGPAQNLPVQWWADASPVISPCKSYSEMTRADSINTVLYNIADALYSYKIKDYIDLGERNTDVTFEGTSGNFKITKLPDWNFNRIVVLVEPLDGQKLDGAAYAGGNKVPIKDYSAKFVVTPKTLQAPTFELAFSDYSKVKLRWWAEVGVPSEKLVTAKETALSSDSVEVEYSFDDNFYGKNSVKIVYDKRKFTDGKPPVIKKFSYNPQGPDSSRRFGKYGDVYKIEAKLKPGDTVSIAIPIGSNYRPDKDSVTIEHFIGSENRWVEEPVDSVVDGYAYFRPQRLPFSFLDLVFPGVTGTEETLEVIWDKGWGAVKDAIVVTVAGEGVFSNPIVQRCLLIDVCRDWLGNVMNDSKNGLAEFTDDVISANEGSYHGLKWAVNMFKNMICYPPETLIGVFGVPKRDDWDPVQGSVETASLVRENSVLYQLTQKRETETLKKLSDPYPECNEDEEICKWRRTRDNLDILLADAILTKFYFVNNRRIGLRRYEFEFKDKKGYLKYKSPSPEGTWPLYDFDEYFMTKSGLIEDAAKFVSRAKACYSSLNIAGRIASNYIDLFKNIANTSNSGVCAAVLGIATEELEILSDNLDCPDLALLDMSILDGHQGKLIAISEAMVRIALLAWVYKINDFRNYLFMRYKAAYDGILAWMELAGPFFGFNNIAIKTYAGLALFEYLYYGTDSNLRILNGCLNLHYGPSGGYSEGTGYSQYIWDDVPYILAALKDAYKSQNELEKFSISQRFLKSPDYMFEFSRPVGMVDGNGNAVSFGRRIPVEVDDGVTYNPDFRVWSKLKDDPKYLAMSEQNLLPMDKWNNPLLAFGYPDESMYISEDKVIPDHGTLWGDFKDGIGLITAVGKDGDTVALSMIAEEANIWKNGQAHDQQDNLSFTLTSSKKGFLIQDPGYSGFDKRSTSDGFHNYHDHNILMFNFQYELPQEDNRQISSDDLKTRLMNFSGDFIGVDMDVLLWAFDVFSSLGYDFSVEGGNEAYVLNRMINEPQNGIIGFTAKTQIKEPSFSGKLEHYRTIMYFGGSFWVIDRPDSGHKMKWEWQVNSPMTVDELTSAGISIYGNWNGKLNVDGSPRFSGTRYDILQNGDRTDYVIDPNNPGIKQLKNYRYTAFDNKTATYVMTYPLGNEKFNREPPGFIFYQLFTNDSKNMRVIVPPRNDNFNLCDFLPKGECFEGIYSSGITMLVKTEQDEWTTHWVLDGKLTAFENGIEIPIKSATVASWYYKYERMDGTFFDSRDPLIYLPALPILLLR